MSNISRKILCVQVYAYTDYCEFVCAFREYSAEFFAFGYQVVGPLYFYVIICQGTKGAVYPHSAEQGNAGAKGEGSNKAHAEGVSLFALPCSAQSAFACGLAICVYKCVWH